MPLSAKSLDPEWRHIDGRRFTFHHFRQQAAGGGSESKTLMTMSESEPETGVFRRGTDDRFHVRRAGAGTFPG